MHLFTLFTSALLATGALAVPASTAKTCKYIQPYYQKRVLEQLETDQIIPDLFELNRFKPNVHVHVEYGTKKVKLGTYFTTTQTLTAPKLYFSAEQNFDPATTNYTYLLVDPDVPSDGSPAQVNFLHWAVANARPSCAPSQSPETITIYEPLTPGSTTQHRYTFLVYRQPEGFEYSLAQEALLQVRTPFDLNDFAQDNGLKLVGANFLKEAIDNGLQG